VPRRGQLVIAPVVRERRRTNRHRCKQLRVGLDHSPRSVTELLVQKIAAKRNQQLAGRPHGGIAIDHPARRDRIGEQLKPARILGRCHAALVSPEI